MRVEFKFSEEKARKQGVEIIDIIYTLKKAFKEKGLVCTSDDEVLIFEGTGKENDYAYMWKIIITAIQKDWFYNTASHCVYIDDNEDFEDILVQIPKLRKILVS